MLNQRQESISNGFSSLIAEVITDILLQSSKKQSIFVICDACYWCATYVDSTRLPADSICPRCNTYSDNHDDDDIIITTIIIKSYIASLSYQMNHLRLTTIANVE